jgi:hypothetical protein
MHKVYLQWITILFGLGLIFSACSSDKTADLDEPIKVSKPAEKAKTEEVKKVTEEVEENFATVTSIKGEVLSSKDEKLSLEEWKIVRQNQKLHQGDWVLTKENASCILKIGLKNSFIIDPNSKINIEKLLVDKTMIKDSSFTLKMGKLLARPKGISPGGTLSVSTPSAVAGVRGTEFLVEYNGKKQESTVAVSEGKVAVARNLNLSSNDSKVPEIKDFETLISRSHIIEANQKFTVNQKDNDMIRSAYEKAVHEKKVPKDIIETVNAKNTIEKFTEKDKKDFETHKKELEKADENKVDEPEKATKKDEKADKKEKEAQKPAENENKKEKPKADDVAKKEKAEKKRVAPKKVRPREYTPRADFGSAISVGDFNVTGYRERKDLGSSYKSSYTNPTEKESKKVLKEVTSKKSSFDIAIPQKHKDTRDINIEKKYLDLEQEQVKDIKELNK